MAGAFYPDSPATLRGELDRCFSGVAATGAAPKAIVVPHAGYLYSGAIAAAAYALLAVARDAIRRVVLIGPSHHVAFRGIALPSVDAFATPLGDVPVDAAGCRALADRPGVVVSDHAHALEHSVEVQLPFLQRVLGEFALLPLVAGSATAEEVAAVLDRAWGGVETLVVVSTDLSHFHTSTTARRMDAQTRRRIRALDPTLDGDDACGCVGLDGFLLTARRRGLTARELAACNSGDVTGETDRVVGYASFAFYERHTSGSTIGVQFPV